MGRCETRSSSLFPSSFPRSAPRQDPLNSPIIPSLPSVFLRDRLPLSVGLPQSVSSRVKCETYSPLRPCALADARAPFILSVWVCVGALFPVWYSAPASHGSPSHGDPHGPVIPMREGLRAACAPQNAYPLINPMIAFPSAVYPSYLTSFAFRLSSLSLSPTSLLWPFPVHRHTAKLGL